MKYCFKCGKELNDNDSFCSKCGTKQDNDVLVNQEAKEKPKRNIYDNLGVIAMVLSIVILSIGSLFSLIPFYGPLINLILDSICLTISILGIINAAGKKKCIVGTIFSSLGVLLFLLELLGLASFYFIVR